MKIIHVIHDLGGGGAEKLVYEFALFQQNTGHDVTVILLMSCNHNIYDSKLIALGVKVVYLNAKKYSLNTILKLRHSINTIKPDIIHSHLFPSQYYVILATLGMNVGLITTEHNTSNFRASSKLFKTIEKFIYSRYSKIIAISAGVEEVYSKYLPKLKNKIVKIENGINLELFGNNWANKSYLNFADDVFLVTMVARFREQKDQESVIRALALLPSNIHLLLVGEGDKLAKCKELSSELNLLTRVHFLGFRTDIPQILSLSDIVVLSSHWEGFGLSIVEGMASGKPVIATNVEGLKDVVKDFGCLFEVGDHLTLSKYILKLSKDVDYYNLISSRCKLRSIDFDIILTNNSYVNLYKSII